MLKVSRLTKVGRETFLQGEEMKNKFLVTAVCCLIVLVCLGVMCACSPKTPVCNSPQAEENAQNVSFGKKYYVLQGDGCNKNQYYVFNKDGTAIYNVTLTGGNDVTFRSVVNLRWFDSGNGWYVLLHNGTRILQGKQDVVFGFGGVARICACAMQWDNAYYICEDCLNAIPNYAQFITE